MSFLNEYAILNEEKYKKNKRRKHMKKLLATILVVSLVGMMFVGCGKNEENTSTTGNTTEDKTTENKDEKKEDPVELIWYTIGTPQQDMGMVNEKLNEYLLEKINATVKMTVFDWGEYDQKMQVKIASGEPFDLMFTCSWANDYTTNVARGALLPLNDLVDEYAPEIRNILNPLFLEGAAINGEIYGLPTNKELGWQSMWIFNKDLVDKYDMDLSSVKTLESLEPFLQIIKENEPDIIPLALDKDGAAYVPLDGGILGDASPFAMQFDGDKILNKFTTDEYKENVATMYRYGQLGYMHPDRAINLVRDQKETGKYFVSKAHYQPYAEIVWQNNVFAATPIEIIPVHEPYANNASTRGAMQGISVTSQHPEKTMEFINLLYTDEYVINLIDHGIEGVHYNKLSDTIIARTEQGNNSYNFPSFSVGNLFNTYSYEGTPDDKWEKFEEFNAACSEAPTLGFTPDFEPYKMQLAAISNVNEEYESSISLGVVDPDIYIPQVIEKLEAAGMNEVIEGIQAQYDEWVKLK